jgi:hypothetical protein
MAPWVAKWASALEDVVREDRPYDPASYQGYLQWYTPRTCVRLLPVVDPPLPGIQPLAPVVGMYHGQTGVNLHLVVSEERICELHTLILLLSAMPSISLATLATYSGLAVKVEVDVRALWERIRHGLGPTQPAEMEAALEQVSEKARRIVALSSCQQLPDFGGGDL